MARPRSSRRVPVDDIRPMNGHRLKAIQEALGVSIEDITWLLGVRASEWSTRTNPAPVVTNPDGSPKKDALGQPRKPRPDLRNEQWDDPTTAIMARFLERNPEYSLIPPKQRVEDIIKRIEQSTGLEIKSRVLSLALGRESSAAHRWLSGRSSTSQSVDHALSIIEKALTLNPGTAWDQWLQAVEEEAASRGIVDIWGESRWGKPSAGKSETDEGESAD